jgi:DNA-binding NarL/FixJ family response regulator
MSSLPITPEPETPVDAVGVLVVDDQLAVREGLARLIACASLPLRCVTTASNGAEALSAVARMHPEVVVLDVDLAGEDGLALIPELKKTAGVLVLTSHGDTATRARARLLGASGFIEKHQPAADLLGSIVDIGHLRMRGEKAPRTAGSISHVDVGTPSAASRPSLP